MCPDLWITSMNLLTGASLLALTESIYYYLIQTLTSSASGDIFPYQAEFGKQHDNLLITCLFNI